MDSEGFSAVKALWVKRRRVALLLFCGFIWNLLYGWPVCLEYAFLIALLSMMFGMGCLFWLFLFSVTGARWSDSCTGWLRQVPRVAFVSGGALTLFLLMTDFNQFYPWNRESGNGGTWYLNQQGIMIRLGICLCLLIFLAWGPDFLLKKKMRRFAGGNSEEGRKYFRAVSSLGLPVLFVVMSVWGIDGVMARESHWHSALWPVEVVVLSALWALCFFPLRAGEDVKNRNFGRCLLAFVLLHGYLLYSEGMLVWFGRIPSETVYFSERSGSIAFLAGAVFLSCLIPLGCLLFRKVARDLRFLRAVMRIVAAGIIFELLWRLQPWMEAVRNAGERWNDWPESLGMGVLMVVGSLPFLLLGSRMEKDKREMDEPVKRKENG